MSLDDTTWMERGVCRDTPPDVFFPGKGQATGPAVTRAKAICAFCPVKVPCLEYALRLNIRHGVWGGTSERERARIRKQRTAARRAA